MTITIYPDIARCPLGAGSPLAEVHCVWDLLTSVLEWASVSGRQGSPLNWARRLWTPIVPVTFPSQPSMGPNVSLLLNNITAPYGSKCGCYSHRNDAIKIRTIHSGDPGLPYSLQAEVTVAFPLCFKMTGAMSNHHYCCGFIRTLVSHCSIFFSFFHLRFVLRGGEGTRSSPMEDFSQTVSKV